MRSQLEKIFYIWISDPRSEVVRHCPRWIGTVPPCVQSSAKRRLQQIGTVCIRWGYTHNKYLQLSNVDVITQIQSGAIEFNPGKGEKLSKSQANACLALA